MRKLLLLLLLPLAYCSPANAQTAPTPTCAPVGLFIPGATGSALRAGATADGAWRGWWCLQDRYRWQADPYVHVVLSDISVVGNVNAQVNAVLSSPNPTAALIAAIAQFRIEPTEAQVPTLRALLAEGEMHLRELKPANPTWLVSGTGTRAAYQLSASGQPGLGAGVAPSGVRCTCDQLAIDAGPSAWCGWAGGPPLTVTLCAPGS